LRFTKWLPVLLVSGLLAQEWVEHLPAGALQSVFFRPMTMPWGSVPGRRPPAEAIAELNKRVQTQPGRTELYRLRASEEELAQDFAGAQRDWTEYTRRSQDFLSLADYFQRRADTQAELAALRDVARTAKDDPDLEWKAQVAWQAFQRQVGRAKEQALPPATTVEIYRAWAQRYPKSSYPWESLIAYETEHALAPDSDIQAFGGVSGPAGGTDSLPGTVG